MHSSRWPEIQATQGRVSGERLDRAWGEFLGRVPWQLFVTLTFDYPVPAAEAPSPQMAH